MMKKKKDKSDWLNTIAIFISFGCLVLPIANFWIKGNFVTTCIWIFLFIAMVLNWNAESLRSLKYMNKYLIKMTECLDYIWALDDLELKILTIDIPEERQKELIDCIEDNREQARAHREDLTKKMNLKEEDL